MATQRAPGTRFDGRKRFGLPIVVIAVLAFALGRARPVLAHSVLVRSEPAANAQLPNPPTLINLWFSEPLEPKFSSAKVVDTVGNEFDQHDSRVSAADPTYMTVDVKTIKPGFYSVLWTTVSKVDGHKLQGSFPFIVLNPDGSLPAGSPAPATSSSNAGGTASTGPIDTFAFWIAVMGAAALFGGTLFALAIGLPAAAVLGSDTERIRAQGMRLQRRLLWIAIGLLLAGLLIILARQIGQIGGVSAAGQLLLGTSFGQFLIARLALALIAGAILFALERLDSSETRAPLLTLMALCGLCILACFSLTAHGDAIGNGSFWATLSDLLHLLGVSIWVGGLASLSTLLLLSARSLPRASRVRYHAAAVAHFSPLAAAAVTLIILTGFFNAVIEVPSLHGLISTSYGRALLVKVALIVPLLAVGGLNAYILRPRLIESAGQQGSAAGQAAARLQKRLSRTALIEASLAAIVLLATGILVILPPTRGVLAEGQQSKPQPNGSSIFQNSAQANDLTIQLTVDPNKVGLNTFRVKLANAASVVSDATLVRLNFTYADPKFGTSELDLPSVGNGVYEAQGANFAQTGRWQVTVAVRRNGFDDAFTSFTIEVQDAAGNTTITRQTQTDPFASPSTLFTTNELGGIVLVLFGVVPLMLHKKLWDRGVPIGAAGTFTGVAAIMLGGTLFFAAHQEGPIDYTLVQNPVPVTNASVAEGEQLYMQNCVVCHGQTGHGDGPAAKALNPAPYDLTVHVGLHADGVLWAWITYGIPRTAMPAWQSKMTDNQRWAVVDFLRAKFQATAADLPIAPAGSQQAQDLANAWAAELTTGGVNGGP